MDTLKSNMYKIKILYCIVFCCFSAVLTAQTNLSVKITPVKPVSTNELIRTGTNINPNGTSVGINSRSLLVNNQPVIPVMGEIQCARVPENEWRRELLKMKAGGVDVASSYIFWIHHEEIEGKYNWTGQRNLRKFLETCKELNMPVVLRIGPWCHGECRNGGFPEWLVKSGVELRSNDPEYLAKVRIWYKELYKQADGLLWKDGGPVVGIQVENEYGGSWEHLMTLKTMAVEAGFDVPFYTRTGWPKLSTPATFGELIPLYGGYAEGFWDRDLSDMPGEDYKTYFVFRSFRNAVGIATEQLPPQLAIDDPSEAGYPELACELGGGMIASYHRRVNIASMDSYSLALVQLGSGGNLPGYYVYHGGTHPDGELTTLNECQNSPTTNYNDLPVKSYDFQAPVGESGRLNGHYHLLRRMHLFLRDFGGEFARMNVFFPDDEIHPDNADLLRWSVRSDGYGGYVFVNNYHRLKEMPAKENVSLSMELPGERLALPPVTVAANSCFFIPFNMKVNGALMKYATAQPVARIRQGNELTLFFFKLEGMSADFVFDAKDVTVKSGKATGKKSSGNIYFENVGTGTNTAFSLQTKDKSVINIVLLSEKASLNLWKGKLAGEERIIISGSEVIMHENRLELTDTNTEISVSVYPDFKSLRDGATKLAGKPDGIFTRYELSMRKTSSPEIKVSKLKSEGQPREVKKGKANVAEQPCDKDFEQAAVWKIEIPGWTDKERDIYLRIPYAGDVARIYAGTKLLTDDFYNGNPFEIGLKRFFSDLQGNELTIKILPLKKDAPVHIGKAYMPDFNNAGYALSLPKVEIYEKRSVTLTTQ